MSVFELRVSASYRTRSSRIDTGRLRLLTKLQHRTSSPAQLQVLLSDTSAARMPPMAPRYLSWPTEKAGKSAVPKTPTAFDQELFERAIKNGQQTRSASAELTKQEQPIAAHPKAAIKSSSAYFPGILTTRPITVWKLGKLVHQAAICTVVETSTTRATYYECCYFFWCLG